MKTVKLKADSICAPVTKFALLFFLAVPFFANAGFYSDIKSCIPLLLQKSLPKTSFHPRIYRETLERLSELDENSALDHLVEIQDDKYQVEQMIAWIQLFHPTQILKLVTEDDVARFKRHSVWNFNIIWNLTGVGRQQFIPPVTAKWTTREDVARDIWKMINVLYSVAITRPPFPWSPTLIDDRLNKLKVTDPDFERQAFQYYLYKFPREYRHEWIRFVVQIDQDIYRLREALSRIGNVGEWPVQSTVARQIFGRVFAVGSLAALLLYFYPDSPHDAELGALVMSGYLFLSWDPYGHHRVNEQDFELWKRNPELLVQELEKRFTGPSVVETQLHRVGIWTSVVLLAMMAQNGWQKSGDVKNFLVSRYQDLMKPTIPLEQSQKSLRDANRMLGGSIK